MQRSLAASETPWSAVERSAISKRKRSTPRQGSSSSRHDAAIVGRLLELHRDDRGDQVVLGREAAEEGRLADPGAGGDLRGRRLEAALGEDLDRGGDDPLAVARRVGPQGG